MNKIVSTNKNSTAFLATILITGTIFAIFPSLMTNTQALEINNNFKTSFGKDSNVKCNNINVNVNGFELSILPQELTTLATEGQEDDEPQTGISFFGGGNKNGPSGSDNNGFVFVCINNNNNVVGEELDLSCEECFSTTASLQEVIRDFIVSRDDDFIFEIPNGEFLELTFEIDTIEQLCTLLEGTVGYSVPLTDVLLEHVLTSIVRIQTGSTVALQTEIDTLIECLLEAGIIVEGEPLPISTSDNGNDNNFNRLIAGVKIE